MSVLVLMPFALEFDPVFHAIRKGCRLSKEDVLRVDHKVLNTQIPEGVLRGLFERDFVVADLSSGSANVAYELAIAHIMNKPVLHLIRDGEDVPFYLSQLQLHTYHPPSAKGYVRVKSGGELSALVKRALTEFRSKDFAHSSATRSNPILKALGTSELLKTQLPWLSGFRQSYRREAQAKEVWIFERSFQWEQSLTVYQTMIRAGIVQGKRSYRYLLPNSDEVLAKARQARRWLLRGSPRSSPHARSKPSLEMRVDESVLFECLPGSIVLYDPLTTAAGGILAEPMKDQLGEDPYDDAVRGMGVDAIPGWMDLLERTYDLRLDPKQVQRYTGLFTDRWQKARSLD